LLFCDILFDKLRPTKGRLDEQFFAKFNSRQSYKKGEIIIRAGDHPPEIFYLKRGFVRLYSISSEGKEITFNIHKPETYFSMIWAVGNMPNNFFYEALTNVEIWRAPKDQVLTFIKNEPSLLYSLAKRTLIGLDGLTRLTEELLFGNARSKVASALLILARRFGQKTKAGNIIIKLPITHRILASIVALTRETASLEVENLKKEKIITTNRHLFVIKKIRKLEQASIIPGNIKTIDSPL